MASGITAPRDRLALTPMERSAYVILLQQRASAELVARALGVSRSTVARLLAALRKKGIGIVSVRENDSWHYEVKDAVEGIRKRWSRSRLRGMAGFAGSRRRETLKPEDESIYGEA